MPNAPDEAELLRVYLLDRDVACPQCDYNLRNLVGTTCPECGEAIALRVASVEPKQAAPITGLILLSAGAGLNALLLIYAFIQSVVFHRRGGTDSFVPINLVELAVMGSAVIIWLKFWRPIRRLGPVQRWALVGACGGLALADILFFSTFVR